MKKTALLLCLFMVSVMMPQAVWADITPTGSSATEITITTSAPGQVGGMVDTWVSGGGVKSNVTKIILKGNPNPGQFNEADLSAISAASGFSAVTTVDMAEAKFVSESQHSNNYQLFHGAVSGTPSTGTQAIQNVSALYQSVQRTVWNIVSAPSDDVATEYADAGARDAARLSSSLWSYAKIPNGYKYCKMQITEGWSEPRLSYDNNAWTHESGCETITINEYKDGGWIDTGDDCMASHLSDAGIDVGDVIKVQRWYKKVEVATNDWRWVRLDGTTTATTIPNVNDLYENGEVKSGVEIYGNPPGGRLDYLDDTAGRNAENTYMWWWVSYKKETNSRAWVSEQDTEPGSSIPADFDYTYRNNPSIMSNYSNNDWVRMRTFNYYQLQAVYDPQYEWKSISFTNGEEKNISYILAPNSDLPTPGSENLYAVVCSNPTNDKQIYNGSSWEVDNGNTVVDNYQQMKFSYWPNIQHAVTSKYADDNIDGEIFKDCNSIVTVDFKAGVVKGLREKSTLTTLIVGKDVTEISSSALQGSGVQTVTFDTDYSDAEKLAATTYYNDRSGSRPVYPKDLTIGSQAFLECHNLTSIEFPNRVVSIGNEAFKNAGTSASELTVSFERRVTTTEEVNGVEVTTTASIDYDHDLTIGWGAFFGCSTLKTIELPIRLSEMGNDAFKLTSSLTSVSIREDLEDALLKTIPSGAFEESAVTNVIIPRSVTEIQSKAFGSCYSLQTVKFQEQIVEPGQTQEPLIVRTGAFATGNESNYHLTDVYVNIDPNDRLLVCEYDAFAFITLVGQTDVTNKKATLHFINNKDDITNDRNWNYYAGQWKKGLAFTQSNLNSMKDGYSGYRGAQQPTVPTGLVENVEPANGWQQFAVANAETDIVLRGNYLRTYSTNTPHYIPKIANTVNYLYDIYRVTAFSDGWSSDKDVFDRDAANNASRSATASKVELTLPEESRLYVPKETGLLLKVKGNSENYYIYQDEIDPVKVSNTTKYPHEIDTNDPKVNLLYPSCIDTNTRTVTVGEGENAVTVTKVVINPTIPYPIGDISDHPSDKFRVFGLYTEDDCFWRSEPNVEINQDMAYLKLPTSLFHWANESSGVGPGVPNSARIALWFDDDDSELTGIKTAVTTAEYRADGYYSVQGVRLSRPQRSGLYIHNGRKVFVK